MDAPTLRFEEFTDGWLSKNLGEISRITSGGTPSRSNKSFWGGDIPWVTTAEIKFGLIKNSQEKITAIGLKNSSAKIFPKGTLLMAMYGQGKTRGQVAKLGIDAATNQACAAILLEKEVSQEYVLQYLGNQYENIRSLSNDGGQKNLSSALVKEIPIWLPSIDEQTKIANFLTAVDTKISHLTKKHELLTLYKKGVMQKIFSRELRFKDDNGREFPDWNEVELQNLCEMNPKTGLLPETFVYIDLESVEKGVLLKQTVISKNEAPSRAQRVLQKEDVLFQMVRPYQGNNLFFNETGAFVASTGYAQIRASEDPRFIYQYLHLESFTAEVINRCTGTSYPAINSGDLGSIEISLPSRPEQAKIASFLTAIDGKITNVKSQLEAAKGYKQGLLQQMFV